MHRLATVHARDNQPTNDQRRHDTAYLNKRLFYKSKVRRLKIHRLQASKVRDYYSLTYKVSQCQKVLHYGHIS